MTEKRKLSLYDRVSTRWEKNGTLPSRDEDDPMWGGALAVRAIGRVIACPVCGGRHQVLNGASEPFLCRGRALTVVDSIPDR